MEPGYKVLNALSIKIDLVRQVLETRIDGMDRASNVTSTELSRRLAELNELRKEVIIDRATLVRVESFVPWQTTVNESLTKLMTKYDERMSSANWISIIGILITIINLTILLLIKIK